MPDGTKPKVAKPGFAYIYQGERLVKVEKAERRKVTRSNQPSGKRKTG